MYVCHSMYISYFVVYISLYIHYRKSFREQDPKIKMPVW